MSWKHAFWIGLVLLASGCSAAGDSKQADEANSRFYQQVAAKQYAAVYQDAAPEFQNAMTSATYLGLMQRIDRKLGACGPPVKAFDWHANATTDGFFQSQGYTRTCANGQLGETVTMVVRNGHAKLAGYYARSPLLLTD
ncbi:MAG: hypothetical protein ACHP7N_01660 [Caulobacterales bacterium]